MADFLFRVGMVIVMALLTLHFLAVVFNMLDSWEGGEDDLPDTPEGDPWDYQW